jgi:hypothetical protein
VEASDVISQLIQNKNPISHAKYLSFCMAYMEFVVGKSPSYKQFVANMAEKMQDSEFLEDTYPIKNKWILSAPRSL